MKSKEGQAFRDGLMTLKQACFRLDLNFWGYLTGWFMRKPLDLAQTIREQYGTAPLGTSG